MSLKNYWQQLFSLFSCIAVLGISLTAFADRHWTGGGSTTDWTDSANWGAGNGSGNWVFGGNQVASMPDEPNPVVVTFSNAVSISEGIWIENNTKPDVLWRVSEDAAEGAGLKSTWGTNNSLNIGTGKHGGLTIESGVYYMPKQLWIGNGAVDSYFTLAGGVFTNNSYVCIGYGAHNRTATMTVTGGEFYEKNDKFIIGQGNHAGCVGVYNQTGGTVSVPELFMSENNGSSSLALSGGTFEVRSWGRVGMGANTDCDIAVSGGEFDTDGELILGCGNNSKVGMTLSGGLFKPKKLWVGSRYNSDGMTFTTTGCDATVTVMDDGTLTTDSGQDIVLGGRENANGTLTVEDGTVSCGNTLHVGWKGNGVLDVQGGTVSASIVSLGSDTTDAIGTVSISGGKIATTNGRIYVGNKGRGTLTVNGGEVTWGDQLMVGWEASSTGTLNVNGGTVAKSDKLLQVGLNGQGYFNMTGGEVVCSDFRLASDSAGAVGVANIEGGSIVNGSLSIAGNGKGTFYLSGGVVEANNVVVGNGSDTSGTLVLNGGTLKARQSNDSFINNSDKLTVNLGERGAVFDTAGYDVTVPVTLNNVAELNGTNGMITKKGLGTLTISSDLNLERTFKFTIQNGIGPVALTGNNTLDEGKKISVQIDPVFAVTNVAYTLLTGLGEHSLDNIDITGDDFYTYTSEVTDGALIVTLAYSPSAPVTARYVNNAWGFYTADGDIIEEGVSEDYTTYVFTGVEPTAEIATIASVGYSIVFEALLSDGVAVTNTIDIGVADIAATRISIVTDEGCAVRLRGSDAVTFAAEDIVNDGMFVLEGDITLDMLLADGVYCIAADSRVELIRPQSISSKISGAGTFVLAGGTYGGLSSSNMTGFSGVLELGSGVTFNPVMEEGAFLPGSGSFKMSGATLYGGTAYGAYFGCSFHITEGTENRVWSDFANMEIGSLSGKGTLIYDSTKQRGPQLKSDNRDFEGTVIMRSTTSAPPTGFYGNNAASAKATWILDSNFNTYRDGMMTYTLMDQKVDDDPICFGVLRQTGPLAYIRAGSTKNYYHGMKIEVGTVSGGESVIEGRFDCSRVNLKKIGDDSWLTLGTNFALVAGSTLDVSAGGLAFNLPESEDVTTITNSTVLIDKSVKFRVCMTSEQSAALDSNKTYLLAKLPAGFILGFKPNTEIIVDGAASHDADLALWRVRFRDVPASDGNPAYVAVVLVRSMLGLFFTVR